MMKRIVAYLLAVALLLTMLPASVLAVSGEPVATAALPVLTPKYPSLSFEGAVQYNVHFTLANGGDLTLEDMGLITFAENLTEGTIDDAVDVIPGADYISSSGLYYVHTNGIPAKNLGERVYFKIYAQLDDGSYVYSNTYSYSTLDYAHSVLTNPNSSEKTVELVTTLLQYGAAAQKYFNYKTDQLMDACLETGGHLYDYNWIEEKPASVTAAGSEYCLCTICGGAKITQEIPQLVVSSLEITSNPVKTSYFTQERFDPAGMVVTATLSDGTQMEITDYKVDKDVLSAADTFVTVCFGGYSAAVNVTVSPVVLVSVSQLADYATDELIVVEGYYAGVAEEGPSTDKEMLIKDVDTDAVIAVRNVPYGNFPDYGYKHGDRIRIFATLKVDGTVNTPNKRYLDFASDNGPIESTVLSSGNKVTYRLDNTVKVSSWEEMQALFEVGAIAEYTYVELTGPIYVNRYAGSDGVDISRVHLNGEATTVSGIRTDGKRTVSMRDNVMAANLGENWADLFFPQMPVTGQYPGYRLDGTVVGLYTGGNNYYFQLTVLDDSWVQLKGYDNGDVVTEVGYAFYRQGTQIQYDQTQSRRNLNMSPEDATAENTVFMDCSSYVNAVYYEAFGVNVLPTDKTPSTANFSSYAAENLGTAVDVIGYWENADYTTAAQIKTLLNDVRGQLQVGDLLTYRHGETAGTSGHVIMYIGDNTFLHCSGSSYNYTGTPATSHDKGTTVEKTNGAVQILNADDVFINTSSTRYLFKSTTSDTVYNFCLLRPLNRGLTPTEESKKRMKMKGVDVEKSVSAGQYHAVNGGETVTYTVKIKNTATDVMADIAFEEILPQCVSFVSGTEGMTCTEHRLMWNGVVGANATVSLTYTVKVNTSAEAGALISSSETTVNGIAINDLTNTVSGYTDAQLAAVAEKAKAYAASGKKFEDPILMAASLYRETLGVTLFDDSTAMDALSEVIDTKAKTCHTTTELSRMLVPNLYGGLDIKGGFVTDPSRTRLVLENYLTAGDIIVAEYGSEAVCYVYVGDGTLIGISSADGVCTSHTISGDAYTSANILVTLIAYDRYAVLRPSMAELSNS